MKTLKKINMLICFLALITITYAQQINETQFVFDGKKKSEYTTLELQKLSEKYYTSAHKKRVAGAVLMVIGVSSCIGAVTVLVTTDASNCSYSTKNCDMGAYIAYVGLSAVSTASIVNGIVLLAIGKSSAQKAENYDALIKKSKVEATLSIIPKLQVLNRKLGADLVLQF